MHSLSVYYMCQRSRPIMQPHLKPSLPVIKEMFKELSVMYLLSSYFLGVMLSIIAAATVIVIFYGMCTPWVRGFTLALSITSLFFNLAQFSPQIYHTCKVKSPGSMSVLLSSIQFIVVLCMFVLLSYLRLIG